MPADTASIICCFVESISVWQRRVTTANKASATVLETRADWEMCKIVDVSSDIVRGMSGIIRACFRRYAWASAVVWGGVDSDWGEASLGRGGPGGDGEGVGVGPRVCDLVLALVERPLLIFLGGPELDMGLDYVSGYNVFSCVVFYVLGMIWRVRGSSDE